MLTYSNFESVTLCHSESFEALSTGVQNAFFSFGGVPLTHRTDSLSAAIRNHSSKKQLTDRYQALMAHYGCESHRTNARCANENGDVESLNGKIKDRIDQALRIRCSRDFASVQQYIEFLDHVVEQANRNRKGKLQEEQAVLAALPPARLDTDDHLTDIGVSKSSTIRVRSQVYSVPSRLIDSKVNARVTIDSIIVSVGDDVVETMPRMVGKKAEAINYRHIIDSLVRKPGAFKGYRYHEQMFPRTIFRIAYDVLGEKHTERVQARIYLQILHIAAQESEEATAQALTHLIDQDQAIDVNEVRRLVAKASELPCPTNVDVPDVDLNEFDDLIPSSDNTNDKECQNDARKSDAKTDAKTNDEQTSQGEFGKTDADHSSETRSDPTGAIPRTPVTNFSGPLRDVSGEGGAGEPLALGVPIGTDETGNRGPSGGTRSSIDDAIQTASGEDVVELRLRSTSAECDPQVGDASRGTILGSEGKHFTFRQTGIGEEPCVMRTGGAIGSSRPQHFVYDVQFTGSAVAAGQARTSSSADAQDTVGLRGPDHRRPGVRATEPGRDGSVVHAIGGTLRARQCVVDEQFSVQQMGPDFQRCDDDSSGDRSFGAPQCDHRNERGELPRGNRKKEQNWTTSGELTARYDFFSGEF